MVDISKGKWIDQKTGKPHRLGKDGVEYKLRLCYRTVGKGVKIEGESDDRFWKGQLISAEIPIKIHDYDDIGGARLDSDGKN